MGEGAGVGGQIDHPSVKANYTRIQVQFKMGELLSGWQRPHRMLRNAA